MGKSRVRNPTLAEKKMISAAGLVGRRIYELYIQRVGFAK